MANITEIIREIKSEIESTQFKLDKKEELELSNLEVMRLLGKRTGLETAIEIIENN